MKTLLSSIEDTLDEYRGGEMSELDAVLRIAMLVRDWMRQQ